MAGETTWDDIFGHAPESLRGIAETLRGRIRAADPETCEVPYPSYQSVNYGVGPKKITEGYAYPLMQKDWINLGFYQGIHLPDPDGLLEGSGAVLRRVKVPDQRLAESEPVGSLIGAAVDERKRTPGRLT